jgi:hypothetical protein
MQSKKTTLVLIFLLVSLSLFSQENSKRQAVYLELLGSGVIGSVNYDFRFKPGNDGLGMRMGFGYVPDVLVFPIGLNGVIGKNRVSFEYGAGVSAAVFLEKKINDLTFSNGVDNFGFIGFGKMGIRIRPKNRGVFFNLHWNPLINTVETRWAWFGLGIGYSWN